MNKTGTQRIETHRLILRRYRIEDAEDMFNNWASDPEVTKFLTWPAHSSIDVTRRILNTWISYYDDGGFFQWAIELKETGRVIGNIAVVRLEEAIGEAEIGYCMGRAWWGQGIMPEALRAVVDYLFDTAGIDRICRELDCTAEDCMAFGDSSNDLSMLRRVKYSIAMGNAPGYGPLCPGRGSAPGQRAAQTGERPACCRTVRNIQARLLRRTAGSSLYHLEGSEPADRGGRD